MTGRGTRIFATILFALVLRGVAEATTLPRVVGVDIGGGVPQVLSADVQVLFANHWQMGVGYGFVPAIGSLSKINIPSQSLTLGGLPFSISPTASVGLDMISPFLRYFPTERNFYFQLSLSMLRMGVNINGPIKDSNGNAIGGVITGGLSVIEPVPTLSLGHIFASQEFYINFSLGISYMLSPWVSASLSGAIPDALGGTSGNQAQIDQVTSQISNSVTQAVDQAKSSIFLIPSFTLTFGLFL